MNEQELNNWWLTLSFSELYTIHNTNISNIPPSYQRIVYNNLYEEWKLFDNTDKENWYNQLYVEDNSGGSDSQSYNEMGAWSALTNYVSNDLVYNENGIFKCIANNINSIPTINNVTNWKCIFNSISISDTIFEDLTTSNKTLVGAINELNGTIGDINTILESI
ncbi:MAG: hypothetical protein M0R46_07010 [Candidatus Muirbacterium halophilum]|nr:hypothetical protein [Candidatus Muirbacterium halophilum]